MMKEFKIYKHPTLGVKVVKVGFSWPAFFITFFWSLYHKLWAVAGIWFGCVFLFAIINDIAKDAANHGKASGLVDFLLLLVVLAAYLIPAFNGNQWRKENLVARGFVYTSTVHAETLDAVNAQLTKVAVSASAAPTGTVEPNSRLVNLDAAVAAGGAFMYCHHCGIQLPTGANFCASCGTKTVAAGPNDPDAKGLAPTATLPSQGSRGTPLQVTDTLLGVVKPILPSQGLRVLQHSVAIMLACLAVPNIWKSPNFEFGVALWSVYPALSLGLAGLVTGIAFVFYQQKMKSIWSDVFIKTAWAVTGISLFGAYLALSSQ